MDLKLNTICSIVFVVLSFLGTISFRLVLDKSIELINNNRGIGVSFTLSISHNDIVDIVPIELPPFIVSVYLVRNYQSDVNTTYYIDIGSIVLGCINNNNNNNISKHELDIHGESVVCDWNLQIQQNIVEVITNY
jgi:hypothetical protein